MQYIYETKKNYENYASGRVLYGHAGASNYPVRLAAEIFARCKSHVDKENLIVYDPCCGSAYMLTCLGFLFPDTITELHGSDINEDVLGFAKKNISLLTPGGLYERKNQLLSLYKEYRKISHKEAIDSTGDFENIIELRKRCPAIDIFKLDITGAGALEDTAFKADIVITDVPYGNLATWSEEDGINKMLESLQSVIHEGSVVAVSSDKKQKIKHDDFVRVEKIQVGKRKIEILKLKK